MPNMDGCTSVFRSEEKILSIPKFIIWPTEFNGEPYERERIIEQEWLNKMDSKFLRGAGTDCGERILSVQEFKPTTSCFGWTLHILLGWFHNIN